MGQAHETKALELAKLQYLLMSPLQRAEVYSGVRDSALANTKNTDVWALYEALQAAEQHLARIQQQQASEQLEPRRTQNTASYADAPEMSPERRKEVSRGLVAVAVLGTGCAVGYSAIMALATVPAPVWIGLVAFAILVGLGRYMFGNDGDEKKETIREFYQKQEQGYREYTR